ncbi:hypothetical protein Btru_068173 [Bulinus truncatus]|nr:hypothetical protein Btru_068173 [Bulinus truncatus]
MSTDAVPNTSAQKPEETSAQNKAQTRLEVQFRTSPKLWDKKAKSGAKIKKKSFRVEKYPDLRSRYVDPLLPEQEKLLQQTVKELMEPGKGIWAVDDSIRLLDSKLNKICLEPTEDNRRRYLEMLMSAGHAVSSYLSGAIFRENVIDQKGYRGKRLLAFVKEAGLKLGIRVDRTLVRLTGTIGEWVTEGLDNYEDVCGRLKSLGAEFVMWRCVYTTSGVGTPSRLVLQVNSSTLSNFASVSQRMGLVPVLSVDVLWLAGAAETSSDSQNVLRQVLTSLFKALQDYHVFLEGVILRVSTVYFPQESPLIIGELTLMVLNEALPPALGGIVLSSQQDLTKSLAILDAVNKCPIKKLTILSFCFSNVIQEGLAEIWAGNDKNVTKSKEELVRRLKSCSVASMECRDIPSPECLDIPSPECLDIPSAECRDIPSPECLDIPSPECLDIPSPECLDIPSPECLDIPSPECRDIPSPECLDIPSPECLDIPSPECRDIPSPECLDIPSPECRDIPLPECLDIPSPECLDIPSPECLDIPSPECRDIPSPECLDIPSPECLDIPSPECLDIPSPECRDIPSPECLDIPSPEFLDIPSPECRDIPSPECLDIPSPECLDIPSP